MVAFCAPRLPANKPRYVMGIGETAAAWNEERGGGLWWLYVAVPVSRPRGVSRIQRVGEGRKGQWASSSRTGEVSRTLTRLPLFALPCQCRMATADALSPLPLPSPSLSLTPTHRVLAHQPTNRPLSLPLPGYPLDIVVCTALGADMYDSVFPTRTARQGQRGQEEGQE